MPGIKAGQLYGYRVHGSWDPANGQRFDATRVLLDPYARAVAVPVDYSRAADAPAMKSVTIDSGDYDWEGDRPLQRPGNNNPYCQDNETSWFDWSLVSKHAGLLRFVRLLIERRLVRDLAEAPGTETLTHWLRESDKSWHGVKLNQPDWSHSSQSIALTAEIVKSRLFIHWILNAWRDPLDFELPKECGQWNRWIDTSLESPEDIVIWEDVRPVPGTSYLAAPHSVVVLVSSISQQV